VLVGNYRSITPADAIARKREFESTMFATLPLWDDRLAAAARAFISACFITGRGPNTSTVLGSDPARQRAERGSQWDTAWDVQFPGDKEREAWLTSILAGKGSYRNDIVKPRYAHFLAELSRAIGGGLSETAAIEMLN
jgi:hypothetical protein